MKRVLIVFAVALILSVVIIAALCFFPKARKPKKELYPAKPAPERISKIKAPRIAFVIDDIGYNLNNIDEIFELDIPVTFSILPNLTYSERIAEEAHRKNYQAILHLPLEPCEDDRPLEKSTILCNMERKTVLRELERAMASVPNLAGISNHMGSKATKDERLMLIIFERARKQKLFFLDNMVVPDSVCERLARRTGIRFVRRSVFLDNESDSDYIKGQINQLRHQALRTGWAVGVGHDRTETISAIKEMLPQLRKDGIKFVFVSDLAK